MSNKHIPDLDENCVMEGQHAHGRQVFWNPNYAPGPMCDKHKNEWLRENDMEKKEINREYTHPDKRTPAWQEKQAHKAQRERHRILTGRVGKP